MAERRTATSSGGRRPAGSAALPSKETNQDTARIALHAERSSSELPGWFWGALGCLSVLGVGLAVLFLIVRPSDAPVAAGGAATPVRASADPSSRGAARGPGIQVEPMASPPSPALVPIAAPRPKAPPKAIKIARSPGGGATASSRSAAAGAASADDKDEGDDPPADEAPKRKSASAAAEGRENAPAAASDDSDDK